MSVSANSLIGCPQSRLISMPSSELEGPLKGLKSADWAERQ